MLSSENAKLNSDLYDLDLFLYDSKKIIHIATAGMPLIKSLSNIDFDPIINFRKVLLYRRIFKYETISNVERDNISTIENYLDFFNFMAQRGFYSYDKFNIDENDDYRFQLISKPIYNRKLSVSNINFGDIKSKKKYTYDLNFFESKKDFPENYNTFDIREYI